MSKDPAFLFYPNDYLGGTMGFSLEMHGGYLLLLIYQFNRGKFIEPMAHELIGEEVWKKIKNKFKTDGELFWNVRLEEEKEKRSKHSEHQRENAMKRWGKNDKPLSGKRITRMPSHQFGIAMAMPLEDEDEDRNEDKDSLKKEGIGGKEKPLWMQNTEDGFQEYLKIAEPEFDKLYNNWQWIAGQRVFYPGASIRRSLTKSWEQYWGTKAGWKNKRDAAKGKPDYQPDWKLTIERTIKLNICYFGKGELDDEKAYLERNKK